MATIPTPEQGKPILDFSAGTFDGSSNLFQSRNGATEHVSGDDVADYVNTSRIYNGLDTTAKTPVGAINEINAKDASDIPYSQGVSVADKLDSLSTVTSGTFTPSTNITVVRSSLYKLGNIKFLSIIFRVTETATTTMGTVSTGFEATYNIDFTAMSDSSSSVRLRIQKNSNSVDISTTLQTNTYYAFAISYI